MIYEYFVFYNFIKGDEYGCGNVQIKFDNEIKSFDDIRSIEDIIAKDKNKDKTIISNYILLSKK